MVLVEKPIEVTLRGFSGRVELFPKRHAVELGQIAFIRMPIDLAAVFRTAVRQDTTQGNLVRDEKGSTRSFNRSAAVTGVFSA